MKIYYFGLSGRPRVSLADLKDLCVADCSLKLASVVMPCCWNEHFTFSQCFSPPRCISEYQ